MVRRSDNFQMHGVSRALIDAEPAAHTMLLQDERFHFLGAWHILHLDGIEVTPLDARLATGAFILVDYRQVPAGC